MSNPLWRDARPGGPYGGEPEARLGGRDVRTPPTLPGASWHEAGPGEGGASRRDAQRGFDPRWHDPGRSAAERGRRGPGGNGRDPYPRASGNGDLRADAPTQRMPTQPGTRPGPTQPGTARRGQPHPAQADPGRRTTSGRADPRDSRGSRGVVRWGSLPGGLGVGIVAAAALFGGIATVVTRTEPGLVLGASVVAGTVVAALAVRPGAGRLIFPAPVLFYLMAAIPAGMIYDRSADSSKTALAIGATQWIANGFFAMALATILAIVLIVARWSIWRWARRGAAAPGRREPATSRRPQADTEQLGRGDMTGPVGWTNPGPSGSQRPRPGQQPGQPDQRPGPRPEQRPGWRPDQRPGPRPGAGPYNFSSGA
jgi:hypothetical protein